MRHVLRWDSAALVIASLLAPWQILHAQQAGQWNIAPRLGLVFWDDAAAIQDPVLSSGDCDYPQFDQTCASGLNNLQAGISALYRVTRQVSLGLAFDVGRPVSNGAYFPAASMEIGGRQRLTLINQRLTILQYAVEAQVAPYSGRLSPFLVGSVGGYTLYKDPGKTDLAGTTGFETSTDVMFSVGIGVDWAFGAATGLRIEVRDMIYTGWDRNQLNPVQPQYQTSLFPDLVPPPPDDSSTLNNFRLSIGITFLPGGR